LAIGADTGVAFGVGSGIGADTGAVFGIGTVIGAIFGIETGIGTLLIGGLVGVFTGARTGGCFGRDCGNKLNIRLHMDCIKSDNDRFIICCDPMLS
jgi:hypothetical protein